MANSSQLLKGILEGTLYPLLIRLGKNGFNNLTLYLNLNLGVIIQFLLIGLMVICIMSYTKKSCFKKPVKRGKIKEFFILWVISCLWICIMIACLMFLSKILLFKVNIIIFLIITLILYFTGNYLSEK